MRVGLAGAGRIGEVHLRTLTAHPDVSTVHLYDPDAARVAALAQEYGACAVTGADELVAQVDAVVIASPTATHVALLDRAMDAGLPAFCEKPVAAELAQVQALAERARRSGCPVQVGFHYRFDPALRELAERVAASPGPRLVRVHSTTEFAPSAEYLAGAGGLIADKLVHELDMVRWLTGSEVTRVAVLPAVGAPADPETMTAAVTLELADGGLAAVWGGYRSVAGFDLTVEVETAEEVVVVGNRRTVAEKPEPVPASTVVDFRDRFLDAYHAEVDAFLALARGAGPNPCDLQEALRTEFLVEAARAALDEGRVVTVGVQPAGSGMSEGTRKRS
ncbi:Gfo/Idh/MocA family oxidoreductase [Blastococcus saxobsidens]|uniref:Putative dehydrogenase n=1 Tax=Blastococcus saxobsidens (strain DD2) TaxID=1146883 RepID=H6RQL2_BLASD|nr:Gfo/Idh/MocA family oxidoreductase [Blastococcus saxobsidens]CCG05380.1 putative dehydrogenase [Blastococcus saxobsidens DD2]